MAPHVVLIHRNDTAPRSDLSAAKSNGWVTQVFQAPVLRVKSGQVVPVLPRQAAANLYRLFHVGPVAVIYEGKIEVRTFPQPPIRDTISIARFCQYKAFAISSADNSFPSWAETFQDWMSTSECEDLADARCLPFHVFRARSDRDLSSAQERRRFREEHRVAPRGLRDKDRFLWAAARPGERHGREPCVIRGLELELGFHWDVSHSNGLLSSADTVWRVRQGYVNVYPDGFIRRSKTVHKPIWSAEQSSAEDAAEVRKGKNAPTM